MLWLVLTTYVPAVFLAVVVVRDARRRPELGGRTAWMVWMVVLTVLLPVAACILAFVYIKVTKPAAAMLGGGRPVTPSPGGVPRYCLSCNFSSIEADDVTCRNCGSSTTAPITARPTANA